MLLKKSCNGVCAFFHWVELNIIVLYIIYIKFIFIYFQVKISELQGPLLRVPVFGDFKRKKVKEKNNNPCFTSCVTS